MNSQQVPTVLHAFMALTANGGAQPLMTFYDDATGERTELSAATLANWVAKTANLLVDGLGLGPGDVAAVRLPPHWQTAAVLLGCWSAGLAVDQRRDGTGADVGFVTVDAHVPAGETYALALAPMGMPFRAGPPPGTLDFVVEVRVHGDHFAAPPIDPHRPALADGTTHADLAATAPGMPGQGRVLIDGDAYPDPQSWLVAPLVAGTSVVLCRNLDRGLLATRLATEQATTWPS
jgi:uncharacterized protein (TIGR03089 family)